MSNCQHGTKLSHNALAGPDQPTVEWVECEECHKKFVPEDQDRAARGDRFQKIADVRAEEIESLGKSLGEAVDKAGAYRKEAEELTGDIQRIRVAVASVRADVEILVGDKRALEGALEAAAKRADGYQGTSDEWLKENIKKGEKLSEQRAAVARYLEPHSCRAEGEDMIQVCPRNLELRTTFDLVGEYIEREDEHDRADTPEVQAALWAAVTRAVRLADEGFEAAGGSSSHWVRDHFLPKLGDQGLCIQAKTGKSS